MRAWFRADPIRWYWALIAVGLVLWLGLVGTMQQADLGSVGLAPAERLELRQTLARR